MWRIMVWNYFKNTITFAMALQVLGTDHMKEWIKRGKWL